MNTLRRAADRGHANHGWLDSHHTFSFADYYDAKQMGFRALRVINEDRVAAGQGFPTHSHRDMEIISYVLDGAIQHRDSMGTGSVIRPGDVQRMSAGTGVQHSEFNASQSDPVHFLQVWILPGQQGAAPGYEQKSFSAEEKRGRLRIVASPDGRDGSITIHQDVTMHAGLFAAGEAATYDLGRGRNAWVQLARGEAEVNGIKLSAGDGLAISQEPHVKIAGTADAELLLFDLA
jgi:quercetin 2,3-dioxygenase